MFAFALSGLTISLIGLLALFSLKYVEVKRGTIFFPAWRMKGDRFARMVKAILRFALARTEELPREALMLLRRFTHIGAVFFARGARAVEQGAYRVADLVSHKHHFERGETKSAYLKTVSEHKSSLSASRLEGLK